MKLLTTKLSDNLSIILFRFQWALSEAKKIDAVLDSDSIPESWSVEHKPFLGVPFTAKEAVAIEGALNI